MRPVRRPSSVTLKPNGGRYPYALARYCPADIRANLQIRDEEVLIRIDDLANCDRWEEFSVSVGELTKLLSEVRSPSPKLETLALSTQVHEE